LSNVLPFRKSQPSDLDAREQALDTRMSFIVEAPAGSGKTGLLMQRYLKLLAEPAVAQPEEVLAITFTNKATSELRERILHQLHAAAAGEPGGDAFEQRTLDFAAAVLARDRALGWRILERPERLNIRTIDSICAEISSSLPLLSGSGGSRRPTTDAKPLYQLAAERTLLQLGGTDRELHEALRVVLLHRDGSLRNATELLANMLEDREQWGELIPLESTEMSADHLDSIVRLKLERAFEAIVCSALTRAANLMPPGMLHRLTALAADLGLREGYKDGENRIAFCALRKEPPAEAAEHLDHWQALISLLLTQAGSWRKAIDSRSMTFVANDSDKKQLKALIEEHKSDDLCAALCAVRELPPARYPDDQWAVTKALFRVLRRALAELKVVFAERAVCDFAELSIAAREALRAVADAKDDSIVDLCLTSGGRLSHLLVDEMQDTSAAQYELIQSLTRTWDGQTQTMFLVGDPKQSIYMFRQARVERFLRTMRERRLGDIELVPLRLTANFRSQGELVREVNSTFEQIFPSLDEVSRTRNTIDVPFVDATATRDSTDSLAMAWHALDRGAEPVSTAEAEHARDIRSIIEHWRNKPLPEGRSEPWSIAVLARNRSHLDPIVAELKRANIEYRAIDIDPLTNRAEVQDALALTRALLHPADRAAWLAVLHAPWCGLALADLLTLVGEGAGTDTHATLPSLIAARSSMLSAQGQVLLERAWRVLRTSLETLGATPFAVHIERTWRSLGGDATLTPAEQNNVLRFFDTLREVVAESSFVDLDRLKARLEKLYAESASGNVDVELLTIHKAKGLEWDVVLVPSLERKSGSNGAELLRWLELDETDEDVSPIVLAPIVGRGEESNKLHQWLNRAQAARENAERKRIFYVLATRAREELHLFASARRNVGGEFAAPATGSLLSAIWNAAKPAFERQNSSLLTELSDSLHRTEFADDEHEVEPELALAASAATAWPPPLLHRLPSDFDPVARFTHAGASKLRYTPASALRHAPAFDRPEGSFAVRAFGNVVHRYLQVLSERLENVSAAAMLEELPSWQARLAASLRGEGLAPSLAASEAARALGALTNTLQDPAGVWLLSPKSSAFTERALAFASPSLTSLRVDRTFVAGPTPMSDGGPLCTWIVDFKTSVPGGLSAEAFETAERAKYAPQLNAYADAARALTPGPLAIMLALYYPLVPRLLCWPA
jgi:ATP-dependent helicase/nuclease subunit A